MVEHKVCFKCGEDKDLNDYYTHPQMGDGHLNKCKICTKNDTKINYFANREYYKEYDRKRQQNPERRKKKVQYNKKFKLTHIGFSSFHSAKRRFIKKQAMPSWVNQTELKLVYKQCPEGMVVDHVVPLNNHVVCGLHVPWNLQYLTMIENSSKGNKFEVVSSV